jgi:hypothetical protein
MIARLIAALAFLLIFSYANAQPINYLCARVAREQDDLSLSDCSYVDGVLIVKYQQPSPVSPYATAFDRRRFYVAVSNDADALFNRVGVKRTRRGIVLTSTLLASPPEASQIKRRQISKTKIKRGGWVVLLEDIQYAAQGQVAGFPIECGTAIRQQLPTNEIVAASECFAYEDRERFLRMLGKVNLAGNLVEPSASGVAIPKQNKNYDNEIPHP